MNYNNFKREVEENFLKYLKEFVPDCDNAHIAIRSIKKTNTILEGLSVIFDNEKSKVLPVTYINCMYEDYMLTGNAPQVIRKYAEQYAKAMPMEDFPEVLNREYARNNIVFQLINTEENRELLSEVPHMEFLDLSVVFRIIAKCDTERNCVASTLITDNMLQVLGFSETELYKFAEENTRKIFPHCVNSLNDVLKSMMQIEYDDDSDFLDMYVITNSMNFFGATAMLYPDILEAAAEKAGSDIFIIPSSVSEVLAVNAHIADADALGSLCAEVNRTEVAPEEKLSDNIYYYNRKTKKISIAGTDGCN